jgi:hypothetical protein
MTGQESQTMVKTCSTLTATLVAVSGGMLAVLLYEGGASAEQQKSFSTPGAAAEALLSAAQAGDIAALNLLLGPDGKGILNSGDPVQDKNRRAMFVQRASQSMKVQPDPANSSRAIILIGEDDFPVAVPLRKTRGKWRFDTEAGKREVLARRIGGNELDAIRLCKAYVDEQEKFTAEDHDRSGVRQYAQRFISSPDKSDGLYWPRAESAPASPIAELVTQAAQEGYDTSGEKPVPYHGYYFQILTGQGPNAPGGAGDYTVNGLMIGGFGLVAWPAEYGASGIKTFLVNQSGVVYEKDLWTNTPVQAKGMKTFNPDSTWRALP